MSRNWSLIIILDLSSAIAQPTETQGSWTLDQLKIHAIRTPSKGKGALDLIFPTDKNTKHYRGILFYSYLKDQLKETEIYQLNMIFETGTISNSNKESQNVSCFRKKKRISWKYHSLDRKRENQTFMLVAENKISENERENDNFRIFHNSHRKTQVVSWQKPRNTEDVVLIYTRHQKVVIWIGEELFSEHIIKSDMNRKIKSSHVWLR